MTHLHEEASGSDTTHFGFETIERAQKKERVGEVFTSVASRYDLMNDVLSFGLHRLWKAFTINRSGVRAGQRVLDIAGGTADLARAFARKVGKDGEVWLTDINHDMLARGRDRLLDEGLALPVVQCDAEKLPFPDNHFDCASVAFGLRNMTDKAAALREMQRVLRPGGRALVLEFSRIWAPLAPAYDLYSFKLLPWLGEKIAHDGDSYRYLAESIRVHPDQETLKSMMTEAGFARVDYHNMSAGIVALHIGFKIG